MELWELHARERIRDTLAHYTWSGDGARLDDLALAFAPDGVLEIRGEEPLHGRDAIVARLSGVAKGPVPTAGAAAAAPSGTRRIVRHNLANIRFTELTRERAAVSSYFTVFTEIGLDHYGRYRDALVPIGSPPDEQWLIAHRFVSTDWMAPNSTMVG